MNIQKITFGNGCFWCTEAVFESLIGVKKVTSGYMGGHTVNPTYKDVCSGKTGHAESVRVVFDPKIISYNDLLQQFWENHDPAQGMRQGGDIGTQYRSAIFTVTPEQASAAQESKKRFQQAMAQAGDRRDVTTSIEPATPFYYAEDDHQQYLYKNPQGYCSLGGIGVCMPPQA